MNEETLRDELNKAGRYLLANYLPQEVQKKIAKEYGEDTVGYSFVSGIAEVIAGTGLLIGGFGSGCVPLAGVGVGLIGDSVVTWMRFVGTLKNDAPWGHPAITIPYHLLYKQPSNLIRYVERKLSAKGKEIMELYQTSPRNFKKRFEKLSEEEQEEILARVISSEKRSKDLDTWLGKNYGEIISSLVEIELKKEEEIKALQKEEKDPMEEVFKALTGK